MCREILKLAPAMWTFVRLEGVEPTNNSAERAVRRFVIWRKTSFGTHSQAGSRFAERMMTVVCTLRQQNRNVVPLFDKQRRGRHARRILTVDSAARHLTKRTLTTVECDVVAIRPVNAYAAFRSETPA